MIFVGIVLFINNAAGVPVDGPSVFIFWIVAFVTFLIPGAFVTAQLGRMFPEEGPLRLDPQGPRAVLGVLRGFVAWWPGPISLVFIGILFANYLAGVPCSSTPIASSPADPHGELADRRRGARRDLVQRAMSYLKMRVTQNYVNVLFWFYAAVIFLIGFAGVWWLIQGQRFVHRLRHELEPVPGSDAPALGSPRT